MDKVDASTRQSSAIHSIINSEIHDYSTSARPYSAASPMAAAATATATATPATTYTQPPPPYSWGPPGSVSSGLISTRESRRSSDNKTDPPPLIPSSHQPSRQSLPSIAEALSSGLKSGSYATSVPAPGQHSQPSPYAQHHGPPIPRSYPPPEHSPYAAHGPPAPAVHPQSTPFARPDQGSKGFAEVPRHPSLTAIHAPPAPQNPYAPRYESQERAPNGYQQHPPPPPAYNYGSGPGPMQAPAPQPIFHQPQYPNPDPREVKEPWPTGEEKQPDAFRRGLKRNLEVYDFENSLAQINRDSSAIQMWSAHYNAIAQEQQQAVNIIPDRMPTLGSVDDMIHHNETMARDLAEMKAMIFEQAQHVAQQRIREQGGRGPGDYDDEGLYDEMKSHGGYGPDSKKRRGRAAPPGRCHSCNRAETPEWRRGPDGARTLCNACGLHYAKLTRKNTIKNTQPANGSQLRPLSKDGLSPRPM